MFISLDQLPQKDRAYNARVSWDTVVQRRCQDDPNYLGRPGLKITFDLGPNRRVAEAPRKPNRHGSFSARAPWRREIPLGAVDQWQ